MRGLAFRILACLAAVAAHAADRDAGLVEKARQEGSVTLYTSMQVVDSRPLSEAFVKKHRIKVMLWRASGEKVAQRVLAEARAGRHEVDVVETDGAQIEILHREKQLAPFESPSIRDVPPEILPAHRGYVPSRLTLYVLAYNTQRVAPADVPRTYDDLLAPRWAGRFAVEAAWTDFSGRTGTGMAATSCTRCTFSCSSRSPILRPAPGSTRTDQGARYSRSVPAATPISRPGLACLVATLATSLLLPMPIDTLREISPRICSRSSRASGVSDGP